VSVQVDGLLHDGAPFAGRDNVFLKGNPIQTTPGDDPLEAKERREGPGTRGFGLSR